MFFSLKNCADQNNVIYMGIKESYFEFWMFETYIKEYPSERMQSRYYFLLLVLFVWQLCMYIIYILYIFPKFQNFFKGICFQCIAK